MKTKCGCGVKRKTRNTRVYPTYQPREWGYKIRYCLVCRDIFKTGMKQEYDNSEKTRSYKTKYRYIDG
jgi:hypothetical protein